MAHNLATRAALAAVTGAALLLGTAGACGPVDDDGDPQAPGVSDQQGDEDGGDDGGGGGDDDGGDDGGGDDDGGDDGDDG